MNRCELSVIMSVYYREIPVFLNQSLESIWDSQLIKPDEIVLIEDGKLTDELYEVIECWKNKLNDVLKIIQLPLNVGLAKALNIGVSHCTGEFIARMDTDDIADALRFQKQIDFMNKNPEIDVIGGSIQEFNEENSNLCVRRYPENTDLALKYIVKASPFAHPTVMFRRCIFDNGYSYPENVGVNEDIDMWFNILLGGVQVANLNDILVYYRVSDSFYNRRNKNKAVNEFESYWNGIIKLHGVSWKLIFPVMRFVFRMMPNRFIKKIYSGKIRMLLNKN